MQAGHIFLVLYLMLSLFVTRLRQKAEEMYLDIGKGTNVSGAW